MKAFYSFLVATSLLLSGLEVASAQYYYSPYTSSYYPYSSTNYTYYPNYSQNTYTYQDGCYLYEYNSYSRTTRLLQNTCNQNYSYSSYQVAPITNYTYTTPTQNQNYYYNYTTPYQNQYYYTSPAYQTQYPSYIDASWSWDNGSAYFYYNDSPYYSNYNYSYPSYSNPSCRLQNGYFVCY